MNKWSFSILGVCIALCAGNEPFKPFAGSLPFLVYYPSRHRGLCVGTLVARSVVLTAAVCVTHPSATMLLDKRPINVVVGTSYRHPRRGIRVQVVKILIPRLPEKIPFRAFLLEKSAAVLLLKKNIPDVLAENPLRSIDIDWKGEELLALHEQCVMTGWHFHYKGDKIYPVHKFLLQRNVRAQFVNIVKMHEWCEALLLKFEKSLTHVGYDGFFDTDGKVCIKDPDRIAQACHGMYGGPLLCKGRQVGIMMAPDAQWTNCTGTSNIIHLLNSVFLKDFMECVSRLFMPEIRIDDKAMKKALSGDHDGYDYIPAVYDRLLGGSSSEE